MFALVWLVPLAIGAAMGLTGVIVRQLPLIFAALLLSLYVAFIAGFGIHTAECPHCNAGDGDRLDYLPLIALFYGSILASLLAGIAAGALVAWLRSSQSEVRGRVPGPCRGGLFSRPAHR